MSRVLSVLMFTFALLMPASVMASGNGDGPPLCGITEPFQECGFDGAALEELEDGLAALEQEIAEVNKEDMRVKSGNVNGDALVLRVEDQTKSRGRNFIFGKDVEIDVSSLNQSDEVAALEDGVATNATNLVEVRNDFEAADTVITNSVNSLEQEIAEVNKEDMRVKSGVVNGDTLTLRVEDQEASRGRNFIFGRDVDVDVSGLNQADEVADLDTRVTTNTDAISTVRNDFEAADTALAGDIVDGDNVVRNEFAAADESVMDYSDVNDRRVLAAARSGDEAVLEQSDANDRRVAAFAVEQDDVVRDEFAAADEEVMDYSDANDRRVVALSVAGDEAVLAQSDANDRRVLAAAQDGDDVVREEFAAADEEVREYSDVNDRRVVAVAQAGDNDVRNEFAAADEEVREYSDVNDRRVVAVAQAGDDDVRREFAEADNVVRAEAAAGDDTVRVEFQEADTRLAETVVEGDNTVRREFAAADDSLMSKIYEREASIRADTAAEFASTHARIDEVEEQQRQVNMMLDQQRQEYRGGIAAATALGMVQQQPGLKGIQVSLGIGRYQNETAGSVVLGGNFTDKLYVNAGATYGAARTYGASMTYRLGGGN